MSAAGLCVMPSGWHPAACRRISPLPSKHPRAILAVLDSPGFADKSPGQVYTILLDRGVYLCSEASMYRLLRERGQSGDRRAQATHPAKKKPELMADGPDQVWSWDITKLKGPARGIWYLLYVIIDIYSRKVIHWEAWPTENGTLANETPYLALRMIQLGQAPALLGHEESEWLECKSFAYEFKKIHESLWKHELAEDVAQFANTESGGLLLIGFHTKRKAGIDTIEKITPVPASDTRLQAYRDILRQRIHPPVGRLLIESFPWNGGQIVCIFVPPQKYENQPYLVSGSVIQGRYMRSGVTIVRRQGDASIPITAEEIHSTLVAGRAFLRGRMGKQAERDGT